MANELEVVDDGPVVGDGSFIDAALEPSIRTEGYSSREALGIPVEHQDSEAISPVAEEPEATVISASTTSALVEVLGGEAGLKQLVAIASTEDPVALTSQLLSPEQQGILLWNAIDNPSVQEQLLSDPNVQQAISDKFFGGLPLDQIAEAVAESFEESDDFKERQEAKQEAFAAAEVEVQTKCFLESGKEVAARFGIDLEANQVAADAWLSALSAFLWKHQSEMRNAISLTANKSGLAATVARGRLESAYKAHMIHLCEQLTTKGKKAPAVKAKAAAASAAQPAVELDPLEMSDAQFAKKFAAEFRRELDARQA